MSYIVKAVRWYFEGFWKMVGFFAAMGFFVAGLQVLIVYPVQVLTTLLIGFAAWVLFGFFTGK